MNAERSADDREEGAANAPPASDAGPVAYAGRTKYDAARAARYDRRSTRRHADEWAVVERLLEGRDPPRTVLDAPCGTGRIAAAFLARGASVRLADWSNDMLERARTNVAAAAGVLGLTRLDLEAPPEPDAPTHDLVICLRFYHHLPDDERRRRVLASLRARSTDSVIVSFHHPCSAHQWARAARRVLTGRRGDRYTSTVGALERVARSVGLVLEATAAVAPYRREFWAARFRTA